MSNQWAAPDYIDGNLATAQPCGVPVFRSPLPNTAAEYVFDQPFMQLRANVSALALGTAHPSAGLTPDYSTYVLVAEGEKQDVGGGLVRWNRTYAAVPDTHDEWESYAYNFIGTGPYGALASNYVGRLRFVERVTSRVRHEYFMVGAGQTYTTPGAIPVNRAFAYVTQFLDGSTQYGGYYYRTDYLFDDPGFGHLLVTNVGTLSPSIPSATQYAAMIKDASANAWAAGVSQQILTTDLPPLIDISGMAVYPATYPSGSPPSVTCLYGQIVAEDSQLSRWFGPIYVRQTRYVLAR